VGLSLLAFGDPTKCRRLASMAKALASRTFLSVRGAGLFPTSVAYFEISGGGVDGAHPAASRCRRVVALEPTTLREPSMG
jgi:hypothetical protein